MIDCKEESLTTTKTLKEAIADIDGTLQFISSGMGLIANAITNKGIPTSNDDTFQTMANNIYQFSLTEEVTYTFNTVSDMKNSEIEFIEGDTVKVLGYYAQDDLVESSLKYEVMTYENWLNSYPEDMRLVSYTTGWWGYKYIKMFVDEYGNHTLKNGLVAKLIIEDNVVYAEQYGCRGDGINLDNTAFRHLFGLNKRDITIKFQPNKTYVIGTEPYNCMYYDEEKFNIIKDNNLYSNNTVCCVNEYATQGGRFVGGWNSHIKPCLVNAKNVTIDGSGSKIFIPDNQFEDRETMNVFSWLELTNYINGLEIKNFVIDGNASHQLTRPSCSKDAICTNHGLFYGGGSLEELIRDGEYIKQITNNNIDINCYKTYTAQLCNVYIHDNIIKNMGAIVKASGDLGGDGILIFPPPLMDNVEISNNQFFNLGRWVVAIDLVNDCKECSNIKINNNSYDYDENNVDVAGSYRGLGWIDFECTRKFINLEVKNNNIHGLCGFAFNGGTNARGNNIQICDNILKSPALNYKSAYPYDFYFYNLNADNLTISGNTIINELNNDNLRSLGYSIHNLTYCNNRIYKEQIIDLSCTGNILIDSNVKIDKNNKIISGYKKVITFGKVSNSEITDKPAHVIFVNNDGGFGAPFYGCTTFPENFDFLISNNSNARYNANFSKCNKPVIDGKYINNIKGSLRGTGIYNHIKKGELNKFESNGYIVKENQILLYDNARRIIANNYGYLPITSNEFAVVESDVNNMNSTINTNQIFYTSKNAYIPLNNGTLGSENILEDNIDIYNGEIESGNVKLKYLCPVASTSIVPYEIYGNVDLEFGKIAEFNANDYNSPQESYIDRTGNYTMTYLKSNDSYNYMNNLKNGEFCNYASGDLLGGTYFSLFEGEDFGEEFTIVIYGSNLYHLGIGSVLEDDRNSKCILELMLGRLFVYASEASVSNVDKHMITMIIKKGGEPIIYFNNQRINIPIKYIPNDINYSTDFKLLIGKTPYTEFGNAKYRQNKIRNIIAYNRRLNYNEIQELYNSLSVVNEFILD